MIYGTFAHLLKKARHLKAYRLTRTQRRFYLAGFLSYLNLANRN